MVLTVNLQKYRLGQQARKQSDEHYKENISEFLNQSFLTNYLLIQPILQKRGYVLLASFCLYITFDSLLKLDGIKSGKVQ